MLAILAVSLLLALPLIAVGMRLDMSTCERRAQLHGLNAEWHPLEGCLVVIGDRRVSIALVDEPTAAQGATQP